jgi:hypothetical protein
LNRTLRMCRRVEEIVRGIVVQELRCGEKRTKVTSWLIYVLRLRQAVSYPFLLESLMRNSFKLKDITWLIQQLSTIQTKTPFINQIGRWCEEQVRIREVDEPHDGNDISPDLEGLDAEFNMIPSLELMERNKRMRGQLCRRCGLPLEDLYALEVSSCHSNSIILKSDKRTVRTRILSRLHWISCHI